MPAAQPQTELTNTRAVLSPAPSASSTSATVRNSFTPRRVTSSRIGLTISSLYMASLSVLPSFRLSLQRRLHPVPAERRALDPDGERAHAAEHLELRRQPAPRPAGL